MNGYEERFPLSVKGHVLIKDDLGNVLLDRHNAIHPQNMARVIARALAKEPNYFIHRIAFGNGGTIVDAAYRITYKTPNDGLEPDTEEWRSRLYNETYSEVIDESNTSFITTGPGASPENDPPSSVTTGPGVRSEEHGLISKVIVECVLNPFEPRGQRISDMYDGFLQETENTEDAFVFDELGLFTAGLPPVATPGYQDVNVGEKMDIDITRLEPFTTYELKIKVDGGMVQNLSIQVGSGSGPGGQITYGDLINSINQVLTGARCVISDYTGNVNTYGYLRFISESSGENSSIEIIDDSSNTNWLFNHLTDYISLLEPVNGLEQGVQNDPNNPSRERERLLTHLIFSPIRKSRNRTLKIVYTLSIEIERR